MTSAGAATAHIGTWHGVAAVVLGAADTEVVVVPELGMLVASFVVDGFDHVARPGGLGAVRSGHTAGVPLLYPWANRLARRSYTAAGRTVSLRGLPLHTDDGGLPIHGTMIGQDGWTITALGAGRVEARFDVHDGADGFAAFPFPHALRVSVRVGRRRLRVDTTVDANGGVAVPVSFGWHPYWRVPGARDGWSRHPARRRTRPAGPARDPHRTGAGRACGRAAVVRRGVRRPVRVRR